MLADIVATCLILSLSEPTSFESFFSSVTTVFTALSIPLLISIGLAPAATFFSPLLIIPWARTVAVVVPSPAVSLVLDATSFTICAPMFSTASFNSISFATVTPSFVTCGAPNFLSITTFLPLGPNVALTAFAKESTPFLSFSLASTSNTISLAIFFKFLDYLTIAKMSLSLMMR